MSLVRNGFLVTLLAVTASSAMYGNVIGTPMSEFRQLYALGHNGRIQIQNLYGDVTISAWDRDDVLVEAIKRSPDRRRLEDAKIVVEPSMNGLSIHTQYSGSDAQHPPSVEYRISVPRAATLDDVKLGNGGLKIRGVSGDIKASSVNGNIKAEKLEGAAQLSTVNGQLDAGFDRVGPSRLISLTSINGLIRLSIPTGAAIKLSASNVSGGIDSEFGHAARIDGAHRLNTTVRRGGATIHLTNVNGGISIHSGCGEHSKPTTL